AAAQAEAGRRSSPVLGGPAFGIVVDGDLVERDPLEALTEDTAHGGAAHDVGLLLGWTREEYRLWLAPSGLLDRIDRLGAVALAAARARCRCGPEVPRGYRELHPGASPAELVGRLVTDHLLRAPLLRLADARHGHAPTYVYEFAWPSRVPGLGSCHALELGFVFDTGETPASVSLAGEGAPRALADVMHAAWVRFATTGDPGWPSWDATRPVRVFDDPATGGPPVVHGPYDRELALWEADAHRTPRTAPTGPTGPLVPSGPAEILPAGRPPRRPAPLSAVRRLRRS
uniref:carboxylesterase family protein n=1 Tax=Streptomyces sp. CRN 30 TaxID=3075613 RepID=UPI002A7F0BE9